MTASAQVPLGEVCTVNPRARRHGCSDDTVVTFVPMAAVDPRTGAITIHEERRLAEVANGFTAFEEGDVLFAKITPCMQNGKAALARNLTNGIGRGSTEFYVLRPGHRVLGEYVWHFVRQPRFREAAKRSFTGTAGQQRVPKSFMQNALIPLPPLEEQRRIVDILNRAVRIETLRTQAAERLREFVPALFVKMFGDPGDSRNGWNVCRLGDTIQGFQGGRNISAGHGETRFRVLKVSAVTDGIFNPRMSKPVPDGYVPPDNHLVREGDLLISRANTSRLVGATAMVEHPTPNVLLPDKIWRFVWRDDSTIEPIYMDSLFKHASVRAALSKMATGTSGSMKNISQSKLKTLPIPLPPLALQRRYAETVEAARAVARVAESSTTAAAILMASLTSELLRNDVSACGMYRQETETHR